MAFTKVFLVNDNKSLKNTQMIDTFTEWHIFENIFIKRKDELKLGAEKVDIDSHTDYRPDKLAYKYYGEDFWYPVILIVNNLGSILQFTADELNYNCLIPKQETVSRIVNEYITNLTKNEIIQGNENETFNN